MRQHYFFSNNSSLAAVHSKKKLNVVINNAAISSADILSKNNQGAYTLNDNLFVYHEGDIVVYQSIDTQKK
ncbi:hypothetical protein HMSSN036_81430 [Paenibacillus macerans]|nr:hypothetical protein HMSSN036_81430 [Paenibacillus macerans]